MEGLLYVFGFVGVLSLFFLLDSNQFQQHPTFEEYKEKHPDLVSKGRVECAHCGGTKQYVRGVSNANDYRKIHYCGTCSKPLYRATNT